MATQTTTVLIDDIDGSTDDVATCAFGLGDSQFEIDLSLVNRTELEEVLSKFIDAARVVRAPKVSKTPRRNKGTAGDYDASAVRDWARQNGLTVSDRGRVSRDVVSAYRAAQ